MPDVFSKAFGLFQQSGASWHIRAYRFVSALAAMTAAVSAPLYQDAVGPMWPHFGLATVWALLLLVSYLSVWVRRHFEIWVRGALYLGLVWFTVLTALNGFTGNYAVGLLLVYAASVAVSSIGAETLWPTSRIALGGLAAVGCGLAFGNTPQMDPIILLSSMGSLAFLEGLAFQARITARKEVETSKDRLRRQQERLRTVTNNVSEGIYRSVPEKGLTFANQAFAEMFGYDTPEEVLELNPVELYANPADRDHLRDAVAGDTSFEDLRIRFRRRDGTEFLGLLSGTVVRDEEGSVRCYDGAIKDITELNAAREAVREERDRFKTLFENLPTPVVHGRHEDDDLVVVDVNTAFEETFGYSPEEARGEHLHELVVPSKWKEKAQTLNEELVEEESVQAEVQRRTSEGLRTFQVQVAKRNEGDGPVEGYGIYSDVTEQKRRERELREVTERLTATIEATPVPLLALDLDGRVELWNPAAERIFGWDEDEVLGEPLPIVPPDKEREFATLRHQVEEGDMITGREIRRRTKSGKLIDLRLFAAPLHADDGEVFGIMAALEDVTEEKRRKEELRATKQQAEEANRMKSAFLANMSHEIRTPLTSIIGFAEAIGDAPSDETETQEPTDTSSSRHFAELIEKSGRDLLDTLNAVLNLSKLEAGEMDLAISEVDVATQVREIAEQFQPKAEEARVDVHVEVPEESLQAQADRGGVRLVLQNLTSNAIKYTDDGGDVYLRARREGDDIALEVEDTGIGMDPTGVDALFEPFRQASEGISREYEGTGIGLAITKKAVEQMGGEIGVETEKGVGTRFTVRLPCYKDASNCVTSEVGMGP